MRRRLASMCFLVLAAGMLPAAGDARQETVHPAKAMYAARGDWPVIAPGAVTLGSFAPFRAVYERHYVQGSGPEAGQPRTDRVIVTAETVGWDGAEAIAIQLIDSGIVNQPDTNARTLTSFVARADLRALFEIGPVPGTARDYYVAQMLPDKVAGMMVKPAAGEAQPMTTPTTEPGFGPTSWVVANMALEPGQRFRLEPTYSPQANPLSPGAFGRVIGQETFTDLAGVDHDAWVYETVSNLTNERSSRHYVINRPPYYLGTASWNLETDAERNRFVWLQSFRRLEDDNRE